MPNSVSERLRLGRFANLRFHVSHLPTLFPAGAIRRRKMLPRAPLLQTNRQIQRASETEAVPAHARGLGQAHVGKALEQHWKQDGANRAPRQMRARAMVRAVAKGLVRIRFA